MQTSYPPCQSCNLLFQVLIYSVESDHWSVWVIFDWVFSLPLIMYSNHRLITSLNHSCRWALSHDNTNALFIMFCVFDRGYLQCCLRRAYLNVSNPQCPCLCVCLFSGSRRRDSGWPYRAGHTASHHTPRHACYVVYDKLLCISQNIQISYSLFNFTYLFLAYSFLLISVVIILSPWEQCHNLLIPIFIWFL